VSRHQYHEPHQRKSKTPALECRRFASVKSDFDLDYIKKEITMIDWLLTLIWPTRVTTYAKSAHKRGDVIKMTKIDYTTHQAYELKKRVAWVRGNNVWLSRKAVDS
jgi:hypothetical protein